MGQKSSPTVATAPSHQPLGNEGSLFPSAHPAQPSPHGEGRHGSALTLLLLLRQWDPPYFQKLGNVWLFLLFGIRGYNELFWDLGPVLVGSDNEIVIMKESYWYGEACVCIIGQRYDTASVQKHCLPVLSGQKKARGEGGKKKQRLKRLLCDRRLWAFQVSWTVHVLWSLTIIANVLKKGQKRISVTAPAYVSANNTNFPG